MAAANLADQSDDNMQRLLARRPTLSGVTGDSVAVSVQLVNARNILGIIVNQNLDTIAVKAGIL